MGMSQDRSLTIKTSTFLKVFGLIAVLWFAWLIRDILALVAGALFLAAVIHPIARWGATHKIPKGVTVLLVYVIMFGLFAMSFALLIPTILQQMNGLSHAVGSSFLTISSGVQSIRTFTEQYGLADNVSAGVVSLQGQLSETISRFVTALGNVFGGLAQLIIVLVMAFYMVVQDQDAIRVFRNFVPESYQETIANILIQVEEKIGRWLTGQLMLSLVIGVLYYIGLLVLGVDGALSLALFASFTEFIPYLGPILGGIPVVIVAFSDSPIKALLAFLLVLIIQQLENQIIVPKMMQKALGLNPLASIIAVLVGAKLFGVIGALIAIPIATAISVVLTELYRIHHERGEELHV
jgi:predicted PurR-regulated permease PerM